MKKQQNKEYLKNNKLSNKKNMKKQKHIGIYIDFYLHRKFKSICICRGKSMRSIVLRLLCQYVFEFKKDDEYFHFDKDEVSKKKDMKKQKHIGIDFDLDLHKKFKEICTYTCRSMTNTILYLLYQYVFEFEKSNENFDYDKYYK